MKSATQLLSKSEDMTLNHDLKRSMDTIKDFPWLKVHVKKVKEEAFKAVRARVC